MLYAPRVKIYWGRLIGLKIKLFKARHVQPLGNPPSSPPCSRRSPSKAASGRVSNPTRRVCLGSSRSSSGRRRSCTDRFLSGSQCYKTLKTRCRSLKIFSVNLCYANCFFSVFNGPFPASFSLFSSFQYN